MNLAEYRKGVNIEGALPKAIFNVSPTKRVVFSKGNLQFRESYYKCSKNADGESCHGIWRFAEHQWEVKLQENNGRHFIKEGTEDKWIDLFGWGTSGWKGGIESYFPWSTSCNPLLYRIAVENGAVKNYANADWGWYNSISNGGNAPHLWRTLSSDEWLYLLNHTRWTFACIEGIDCLLLLPENFIAPDEIRVFEINGILSFLDDSGYDSGYFYRLKEEDYLKEDLKRGKYSCNLYEALQFSVLEDFGVVALPAGCQRNGRFFSGNIQHKFGTYWLSDLFLDLEQPIDIYKEQKFSLSFSLYFDKDYPSDDPSYFSDDPSCLCLCSDFDSSTGRSVRLVHDL